MSGHAEWSVANCPFLSCPHMVRREAPWTKDARQHVAGEMIDRNPGVTLLWTTRRHTVFKDGQGKPLIEMGMPMDVTWHVRVTRSKLDYIRARRGCN